MISAMCEVYKYRAFGADWDTEAEAKTYADRIFRKFSEVSPCRIFLVLYRNGKAVATVTCDDEYGGSGGR